MSEATWRVRIGVCEVGYEWTYETLVRADDPHTAVARAAIRSGVPAKNVWSAKVVIEGEAP